MKTSEIAEKLQVHPNTVRNWYKQYSDFIPHSVGKRGVVDYHNDALSRIEDIRTMMDGGVVGDELRAKLSKKFGATIVQSDDPEPTPQPQPSKQGLQSNVTTTSLLVGQADVELVRRMDLVLKTQHEHNNELGYKQDIIDKKNGAIEELENELAERKAETTKLQRKINKLSFFGWRDKKWRQ